MSAAGATCPRDVRFTPENGHPATSDASAKGQQRTYRSARAMSASDASVDSTHTYVDALAGVFRAGRAHHDLRCHWRHPQLLANPSNPRWS
jgi:hypothetical protein